MALPVTGIAEVKVTGRGGRTGGWAERPEGGPPTWKDHPLKYGKHKVNITSDAKAECKLYEFMKQFLLTE